MSSLVEHTEYLQHLVDSELTDTTVKPALVPGLYNSAHTGHLFDACASPGTYSAQVRLSSVTCTRCQNKLASDPQRLHTYVALLCELLWNFRPLQAQHDGEYPSSAWHRWLSFDTAARIRMAHPGSQLLSDLADLIERTAPDTAATIPVMRRRMLLSSALWQFAGSGREPSDGRSLSVLNHVVIPDRLRTNRPETREVPRDALHGRNLGALLVDIDRGADSAGLATAVARAEFDADVMSDILYSSYQSIDFHDLPDTLRYTRDDYPSTGEWMRAEINANLTDLVNSWLTTLRSALLARDPDAPQVWVTVTVPRKLGRVRDDVLRWLSWFTLARSGNKYLAQIPFLALDVFTKYSGTPAADWNPRCDDPMAHATVEAALALMEGKTSSSVGHTWPMAALVTGLDTSQTYGSSDLHVAQRPPKVRKTRRVPDGEQQLLPV